MVDGVAAEIAVFVYIPSGIVNVPFRIKAVANITAFNLLVTHPATVTRKIMTSSAIPASRSKRIEVTHDERRQAHYLDGLRQVYHDFAFGIDINP